jgi:hypothetical protein
MAAAYNPIPQIVGSTTAFYTRALRPALAYAIEFSETETTLVLAGARVASRRSMKEEEISEN